MCYLNNEKIVLGDTITIFVLAFFLFFFWRLVKYSWQNPQAEDASVKYPSLRELGLKMK